MSRKHAGTRFEFTQHAANQRRAREADAKWTAPCRNAPGQWQGFVGGLEAELTIQLQPGLQAQIQHEISEVTFNDEIGEIDAEFSRTLCFSADMSKWRTPFNCFQTGFD